MAYPPVVVVDSDDQVTSSAMLAEAWEKGLIHRVVYVIVEDSKGRILLHQRSKNMFLYPGRWDTAGGHVDVSPDYEVSAKIELEEESGISGQILEEAGYFYSEEPYGDSIRPKRFIKIFKTRYDGEPGAADDYEVALSRWFAKDELRRLTTDHPEQIAIGLSICLPYILEEYEDHTHQAASQSRQPVLDIH